MCTQISRYSRLFALVLSLLFAGFCAGEDLEGWERSGIADNINQEL